MSTHAFIRRMLASAAEEEEWREHARCRDVPVDVFFPLGRVGTPDPSASAPAKAVCGGCPVRRECAEYALARPALLGVWGGLTEAERNTEARARSRGTTVFFPRPSAAPAADVERPPASRGELLSALETLAALHPGRWAKVATFRSRSAATTRASLYRTGQRPVPPGRWEFEGRRERDGGGSVLYARFLGAEEATGA